ncbi:NAD(P)/FAD-dependent oxidoreductase [Streptomyces sp. 891-h]|uniref:phytoene desaturase family protein n=1 Tax=unclassified Streptomyces TaxID=2593676 RepID=UPI001FAA9810|nr:NAD(P)/FAD-dependent oxidoreductase [Streptomyces sp. 891-h]UNZ19773.1 NAD(P)/FAD-dependent oxidoreductase [Streptomyces sp. 891-h]
MRVVVVGAGMGGMAAAARLAVAGHEVVVHERGGTHGGAVRRYVRDGFGFDTGPGLLQLPAVYRDLFVKTGRDRLEDRVELVQVPVTARHVFADGTSVTLPNASRGKVIAALDDALGTGAGERWAGMLTRAREAWEVTRRPLLEEPLRDEPSSRGALVRDGAYPALRKKGLLGRLRTRRAGGAAGPALAEIARDELGDPRLAAMLCGCAWAHGLDPAEAPASAAVLAYVEDTFGTWYVRGGMRALADALYERCRERKVTFHFDSAVTGVREKDGRAAGVELADGSTVDADVVVAGAGPGAPGGQGGAGRGMARFTVLLALRGARPEGTPHRTLVHRAEAPGQPLTLLRPDDPALRPDDQHEAAVLTLPVPPGTGTESGTAGELVERLLALTDAAGLGLSERLLWHEVRTPADHEAETGAPGGLVPPPALPGAGGAFLHPANSAPLPGLYAAGGWSHPGGGLPAAGMSGAMVAGLVQDPEWRGSV